MILLKANLSITTSSYQITNGRTEAIQMRLHDIKVRYQGLKSGKSYVKQNNISTTSLSAVLYILMAYDTVLCKPLFTGPSFTLSVLKRTIIT